MLPSSKLTLLLAIGAAAIPFDGPSETFAAMDLLGRTPMPTSFPQSPAHIFRRQADADDALCGYINGIESRPISCSVGTCMYNAALNWFGCCTGTARSDCEISTSCVASASINSCINDPDCANNPYVTACTDSEYPACASISSVADEGTITHVLCAASATKVELLPLESTSATALNGTDVSSSRPSSSSRSSSSSSSRRTTSSEEEEESSTSTTVQSTRPGASNAATTARNSASASQNASPTSSQGSAPDSLKAAQAVLGAGGLVGLVAWFF